MDFGIKGKRAFVSGSSSGIGTAIAIELAKEGCDVAVHGRDADRAAAVAQKLRGLGVKACVTVGDLTSPEQCREVASQVEAGLGDVDIVVNNCGVALRKDDPVWSEIPYETWIDSYRVNLLSTVEMSRLLLNGMKRNGWGRIINISTVSATGSPGMTEYGAAKAALNKLTADMAKDLGPQGITVNGVMPGAVLTPAIHEWLGVVAGQQGWSGDTEDFERNYLTNLAPQPIPRFGRPDEIAALVAFLASERARHLTGALIRVDGGSNRSVNI